MKKALKEIKLFKLIATTVLSTFTINIDKEKIEYHNYVSLILLTIINIHKHK